MPRRHRIRLSVALTHTIAVGALLVSGAGLVALAGPAGAASFTVNDLGDGPDVTPGNGVCETATGNHHCTLRAALGEAGATAAADSITVPAGTIAVGSALVVAGPVTVTGAGTVLDGGHTNTLFRVTGGTVGLRHLVLQNGDGGSAGGGLQVASGGTADLRDSVVRNNFAFTGGGGIFVEGGGTLAMVRTSVVDNDATGAFGGGLLNQGDAAVRDSLFAGNDSNRVGGVANSGNLQLLNVTISGNTVHTPTAGVGGLLNNGFAFLNNVTVTDNTGKGNNAGSFRGGGIQTTSAATTAMDNSIVAGNHGAGGPADCSGSFSSDSRYDLIGDATACGLPSTTTWVVGADPLLGPLTTNGGPTRTHLPGSTSPVVDAASPAQAGGPASDACEANDQRGVQRLACDMGAVERFVAVPSTIVVDATDDQPDARPGNATCQVAGGGCTLRAAVQEANALPGPQTLSVPPGTYVLDQLSSDEGGADPAAAGDLDLTDDVVLRGAGRTLTVVDGGGISRVFDVHPGVTADLRTLTVRHGTDDAGGDILVSSAHLVLSDATVSMGVSHTSGGGIATQGLDEVLEVHRSTISGNTAEFGDGGGIDAEGTMRIVDSLVSGNHASFGGGGLYLTGDAQVRRTTVRGNSTGPGALSAGGGISARGLLLEQSAVSGNTSGSHGGGVYGTGTLRNSTISGNTATEGGGVSTSGTLSLVHVTVAGNSASAGGTGTLVFGSSAALTLRDTILYDPGSGPECSTLTPTSLGSNIARDGSCGLTSAGDRPSTDPALGPLTDNGGPTMTRLPLPTSAAVNHGVSAGLTVDQRGVPRPQAGGFDIGAVEGSGTATSRTSCVVTATRPGPPAQQDVTVRDTNGIASIAAVHVVNGTVHIPSFPVGTTAPVVLTATKTDQSRPTSWTFQVTDQLGNVWPCD
jgi:CSLREA domain-containing protein